MIVLFAIAQMADAVTAILMPPGHELNSLPQLLLGRPEWAVAAKVALIVFVAVVVLVIEKVRPRLALGILAFGIVAGTVGTISNLLVLRAVAEGS